MHMYRIRINWSISHLSSFSRIISIKFYECVKCQSPSNRHNMVADSPQIGVGLGFDSQGCVTFFHKYCFPNLY